jgi:hypothetical protein
MVTEYYHQSVLTEIRFFHLHLERHTLLVTPPPNFDQIYLVLKKKMFEDIKRIVNRRFCLFDGA